MRTSCFWAFFPVARTTLLVVLTIQLATKLSRADPVPTAPAASRPNFVIIFTDDQGYGDLSCFGSETIQTPNIDRLAAEGTKFTSFYAQVVCGPSRSALLTGRYPVQSLGWSMPASEITIAEILQDHGYRTGCFGKWDVSSRRAITERMPNAQGFDEYWGPLGANDGGKVSFHHNNVADGETSDMGSLTRLYTDRAIEFLEANHNAPFFLYLAHTMVHSIVGASPEFVGTSKAGLFGDAVQEIDFHTGRLLKTLERLGLNENTIVIFTSDNGPWSNASEALLKRNHGAIAWGSAGPLREAKGSTYEGGIRVPCVIRWTNHIPAGRVSDAILATIDFLPTFAELAEVPVPQDRPIDGVSQVELLLGQSDSGARDNYAYYCKTELHAVRKGDWKLVLPDRKEFYNYVKDRGSNEIELYNLKTDLGETTNVAKDHPEIVKELQRLAEQCPKSPEGFNPGIR